MLMARRVGARFLAVDDDLTVGAGLQRMLRRYGQVVLAANLAQARQHLHAEQPWSAFVVDLNLPDGSGLDFLADVRRTWPQVPALLLTGEIEGAVVNAAYDLRVEILSKPADAGRIGRFIEKALSLEAPEVADRRLSAALTERVSQIRAMLGHRPVDVRARCEIGRLVAELKSHPERYGVGAVAVAASSLGEDVASLYRHARVADRWGRGELDALLARRTRLGRELSWSHWVLLASIECEERRSAWTERTLDGDLTVRELEVEIERESGHE